MMKNLRNMNVQYVMNCVKIQFKAFAAKNIFVNQKFRVFKTNVQLVEKVLFYIMRMLLLPSNYMIINIGNLKNRLF